jgi:RHS repeat-associated protein
MKNRVRYRVINGSLFPWKNAKTSDYLFNGKEKDEESGMYYYETRYYAPSTFISRDSLFEKSPTMSPLRNKEGMYHQYNNLHERITDFAELGGNQDGTSYGFSYTKTITVPAKLGEKATSTSQQQYMIVSRDKDNNVSYKIYNNEQDYNDATKDW